MKYINSKNLKTGIYSIVNCKTGKKYIGMTIDFRRRYTQYLYDFNNIRLDHINSYLYNSMVKYGLENFNFEVVEYCDKDLLEERELYWILHFNTLNRSKGFNLRLDIGGRMKVHGDTSKKISNNLKLQWANGERDGHSEKLKKSWENNSSRKEQQSLILKKNLTKYKYILTYSDSKKIIVDYSDLKKLGLHHSLSYFYRNGSNECICNGVHIIRVNYEN